MAENLFAGLPPPSINTVPSPQHEEETPIIATNTVPPLPPPKSILKSSLKRPNPTQNDTTQAAAPKKSLKFKTTTDASEAQIIEAMRKISSHVKNPSKISKAAKLAIQLIQAGSVNSGTSDYFFDILEAAMSSSVPCTDPSVRTDYHSLFSEAQAIKELLNKKQKNQLTTWTISAVVANDLHTDDSFVFSKAAGQIKEAINNLPVATEDDDMEEAMTLKDSTAMVDEGGQTLDTDKEKDEPEADPFGLDALIPGSKKKSEKSKAKNESDVKIRKEDEEETKRFLKSQREALITCLDIAARRYKVPWCQTVIDILVKHASDNVTRFTACQRDAIGKLWASIRDKQSRRKQGKSVNGKLDVNGFEWLQQKYANEKISIRHSVGSSGERRAQQWLG
ncbi:hypothetical protein TanjilG_10147 [Lupinus angustifolius]|uniref:Uncharacterized protein n=1 Tax=Lupinus angustifolius TaxID=3871 RepID=A0A1J7H359_LUPAN|nr:PREDICTED: uncharacterized protein LOC109354780 isoform X1 [Lupinus angustifolius]OIW07174.1 hypothetical protein TanjilG_10147 [Lupinus angustifolius]